MFFSASLCLRIYYTIKTNDIKINDIFVLFDSKREKKLYGSVIGLFLDFASQIIFLREETVRLVVYSLDELE